MNSKNLELDNEMGGLKTKNNENNKETKDQQKTIPINLKPPTPCIVFKLV